MRRLNPLLSFCVLLSGCFGPGEGVEVPQDKIYFPTGLALDVVEEPDKSQFLYVVNSDFDLQYNGGAVQSFRLDDLADSDDSDKRLGLASRLLRPCNDDTACKDEAGQQIGSCESGLCVPTNETTPCGALGDRSDADRLLYPGRCNPIDPTKVLENSVKIGAFATDAVMRRSPDGSRQRLFVPVRGDSTLHWIDVEPPGSLDCGQQADPQAGCDARHRAGDDPAENSGGIKMKPEPFAIDATEHGERIVVTNQTSGTLSLFTNEWDENNGFEGPRLRSAIAPGPLRPVGVAALPTQDPTDDGNTFLVTYRDSPQVRLVRFAPDLGSQPENPFLVNGGGIGIEANSVGSDSRGIAVDASERRRAQQRCAGDEACLAQAALVPLDVFVANRSPASLLIGRTRPPQEYPYFYDSLPLTIGPSRAVVGQIKALSGELETRVFVACFDSRRIFVYDPKRARFETEIASGRGAHALVVDTQRSLLYVGHFTDSYVGVYSLDLRYPATYGTMLCTLGTPKPPRSSK